MPHASASMRTRLQWLASRQVSKAQVPVLTAPPLAHAAHLKGRWLKGADVKGLTDLVKSQQHRQEEHRSALGRTHCHKVARSSGVHARATRRPSYSPALPAQPLLLIVVARLE
jgi:hypothetical protein